MTDIRIFPSITTQPVLHQQWEKSFMIADFPGMAQVQAPVHGHHINFEVVVRPDWAKEAGVSWAADPRRGVLVVTIEGGIGNVSGLAVDAPIQFGNVAGATVFFQLAVQRLGRVTLVHFFVLSTGL